MTIYYIYQILVGLKIYIGTTTNPELRWKMHKRYAKQGNSKSHTLLYTQMDIYGYDECLFYILHSVNLESFNEARKLEQLEINKISLECRLNSINAHKKDGKRNYKNYDLTRKSLPERIAYNKTYQHTRYNRIRNDPILWAKEKERNKLRYKLKHSMNDSEAVD